VIMLALADNRR